jgi:hypothetical protein
LQSPLSSSNSSLTSMDTPTTPPQQIKFNDTSCDHLLVGKCKEVEKDGSENAAYQKIITNETPVNLISLIENSRVTGRTIRNLSNVLIKYNTIKI